MTMHAKEIKSKISSVENIKKITHAMEVVSVSKMKKATGKLTALRTYAQLSLEILAHIAQNQVVRHPLLETGGGSKTLLIYIGADRGLCGSYNQKIGRKVTQYVNQIEDRGRGCDMITVGSKAAQRANELGKEIIGAFDEFSETVSINEIGGLCELVLSQFQGGTYNNVVVAYTHHITALKHVPRVRQILPVTTEQIEKLVTELEELDDEHKDMFATEDLSRHIFEPSEEAVLSATLPRLTEVRLYRALLESFASEHSARMFAMKNATENAEEMIDDLNISYNRARQESITREISEIAAGAEALSKQ